MEDKYLFEVSTITTSLGDFDYIHSYSLNGIALEGHYWHDLATGEPVYRYSYSTKYGLPLFFEIEIGNNSTTRKFINSYDRARSFEREYDGTNFVSYVEAGGKHYTLSISENCKEIHVVDLEGCTDTENYFTDRLTIIKNGKYGYKDYYDNIAIECMYDRAFPFSEGLALVTLGGKDQYINKKNEVVVAPNEKFKYVSAFTNGLAVVQDKKTKKYGYIDISGEVKIPCMYDVAYPFYLNSDKEVLATVVLGTDLICITRSGEVKGVRKGIVQIAGLEKERRIIDLFGIKMPQMNFFCWCLSQEEREAVKDQLIISANKTIEEMKDSFQRNLFKNQNGQI